MSRPMKLDKRLTDRVKYCIALAEEEARLANDREIDSKHLLLGLIREGEGIAAQALKSLGISLEFTRDRLKRVLDGDRILPGGRSTASIPLTLQAEKTLELSLQEAQQLGQEHIGTQHLLLGLAQLDEGATAELLTKIGTTPDLVRKQVTQVLSQAQRGKEERGKSHGGQTALPAVVSDSQRAVPPRSQANRDTDPSPSTGASSSRVVQPDFFISYTSSDRDWAEWIAWQLEAVGYSTVLQDWDFRPGNDFVQEMQRATVHAKRIIAVLSTAYFGSAFGNAEWHAAFAKDPTGEAGLLVPVRIADCNLPGLLAARIYVDLVGLDETSAITALLEGASRNRAVPTQRPSYPSAISPPFFPGMGPTICNLPPRNPNFVGREDLLLALERSLAASRATTVVAAHGLGGIGKSQLAMEYAYQHIDGYDLIWWISAETPLLLTTGLAALAPRLGLPTKAEQEAQAVAVLSELAKRDRWLLVFDNAEDSSVLTDYGLPALRGHIILTSRNPVWGEHATRVAVDVLSPSESVSFLLRRTGSNDHEAAAKIANELGGLPLALEQAAAYAEQVPLSLAEYLNRYSRHYIELLTRGVPSGYPAPIVTTWELNVDQVATNSPAAIQLLHLCAFLSPEPIPPNLFAVDSSLLPAELALVADDDLALDEAIAALHRYSLVSHDRKGFRLHRLMQMIVRVKTAPSLAADLTTRAVRLLVAAFPDSRDRSDLWPLCELLVPHAVVATEHAEKHQVSLDDVATLMVDVGQYLGARAEYRLARQCLERAAEIMEAEYGPEHPAMAFVLTDLGGTLNALGDHAGAQVQHERALAIDEAALGAEHPEIARILTNLSNVLRDLGDFAGARARLERALAIFEASYGREHPELALVLDSLGNLLADLGDPTGAQVQQERALSIAEAAHGSEHPNVAIILSHLASRSRDLGDVRGARIRHERALAILESSYGPEHPEVADALTNLGNVLSDLGDFVGARAKYERALSIDQVVFGPQHGGSALTLRNLSLVQLKLGGQSQARVLIERALVISKIAYGSDHPEVALTLVNFAAVLTDLGVFAEARVQLKQAHAIFKGTLGPNHPFTRHVKRALRLLPILRLAGSRVSPRKSLTS
jgi:tetratricopeptide (TPR) repeat protein